MELDAILAPVLNCRHCRGNDKRYTSAGQTGNKTVTQLPQITEPLHRLLFACSLHMYRSIVYLAMTVESVHTHPSAIVVQGGFASRADCCGQHWRRAEPNRPRAAPHAARIRPRCSRAEPLRPRVPSAAEVIPAVSVAGAFAPEREYLLRLPLTTLRRGRHARPPKVS